MTKARDNATQGGLTLINSTTFTTVSSVSLNNVFSNTYQNYRVEFNLNTISAGNTIRFRFRNSGADRTDNKYMTANVGLTSGNVGKNDWADSISEGYLTNGFTNFPTYTNVGFDVFRPFNGSYASNLGGVQTALTPTGAPYSGVSGVMYETVNSNDGFSIYVPSGTFSGVIKVYGYRD